MKWTKEQQEKFFAENPEFMSEYPISRDLIYLLRDPKNLIYNQAGRNEVHVSRNLVWI